MEPKFLTAEEERDLLIRWQDHKDYLARDQLTDSFLLLVTAFVRRVYHLDTNKGLGQDLVQEGRIGLLRAMDKFDRNEGTRFSGYAWWWIRAYVGREFAGEHTEEEPLDQPPDKDSKPHSERIADPSPGVESKLGLDQQCDYPSLLLAVERLPERERTIIKMLYLTGDEPSLTEIGNTFTPPITRERVRQLGTQAISRLRRFLAEEFTEDVPASVSSVSLSGKRRRGESTRKARRKSGTANACLTA